eukprot:68721_1
MCAYILHHNIMKGKSLIIIVWMDVAPLLTLMKVMMGFVCQIFYGTITLILNTKDRTISFKNVESEETILMFEDIKIENGIRYKLGITIYCVCDTVSLIDLDLK